MVLALERTLEGDPWKTFDGVQRKGLPYFILHLIGISKYILEERRNKKTFISEIFFPYSEKKSGSVSQLIL